MAIAPASSRGSSSGGSTELAYVENLTGVAVTGTTDSPVSSMTLVISAGALTFDGLTRVRIEVQVPLVTTGTTVASQVILNLTDGTTTDFGKHALYATPAGAAMRTMGGFVRYLTPTAGSHTFQLRAWRQTADGNITCGGGDATNYAAGYIRISTA